MTSLNAFYTIGSHLYDQGFFPDAADVFFICVFFDPLLPDCWQALGLSWEKGSDLQRAQEAFRCAYLLFPDNPCNALYFANSLIANGNKEEAQPLVQKAKELLFAVPRGKSWEEFLFRLERQLY
jgi:tetratricopeptide (TPR) repeat protein